MKKTVILSLIWVSMMNLLAFAQQSTDVETGEKVVLNVIGMLNKMYPTDDKLTPAQEKENDIQKKAIGATFDIETMSKRALSNHYSAATPAEISEFKDLFRQFVVRNATANASSKKADIKVKSKEMKGSSIFVSTKVRRKGSDPIMMKYELNKVSDGSLKVVDLVLDDESVMAEYQSQFDSIIKKNNMAELLSRIRNSLKQKKIGKKATRI